LSLHPLPVCLLPSPRCVPPHCPYCPGRRGGRRRFRR
jgi:hypothetical protein